MTRAIRFIRGSNATDAEAEEGATISAAIAAAGLEGPETPCGGKGLCGKCRIRLLEGELSPPGPEESSHLSAAELEAGVRLACLARVAGCAGAGLAIELPEPGRASLATEGPETGFPLDPPVRVVEVELEAPGMGAGNDDETRLLAALAAASAASAASGPEGGRGPGAPAPLRPPAAVSLGALADLGRLARGAGRLGAVVGFGRVIGLRPAGRAGLGLGVDLGTTSVACRLVDLATGRSLGEAAALNAQRRFGADVISRIEAASAGSLGELRDLSSSQIASMADSLAREAGAEAADIVSIAVAGNPTMLHLLAGAPPGAIAAAPFVPVFTGPRVEDAFELGLAPRPGCSAVLLPGIAAYVGADIVAGMASIGLRGMPGRSLFLDLGTNGEIAMGGRGGILCCAAAAGPAFEGAGLEMGSAGTAGAIDSVWLEGGLMRASTIGDAAPAGICGSGLVSALAALLDSGLVDSGGRIADEDEAAGLPKAVASRLGANERGRLVYLDEGRRVYLSQADIRAAQLAKAAIAAGIDVLAARGPAPDRVFLAGGFGSLVDPRSAARIGLIPPELAERAVAVGNASLAGATAAVLSRGALEECSELRGTAEYVELSGSPEFNSAYVERMIFPELP